MLERVGLSLLLILLGVVLVRAATVLVLRRRARHGLGLDEYRPGRAAILYFTAPGCAPCESVQRPALDRLVEAYGRRLQVIEVDATQRPDLADAWGVLSVPTTFIIDSRGRPRGVNHGVARAGRLIDQLMAIGEVRPATAHGVEPTPGE
jgi:thiol-disulfide isomerase/thioredoxin